MTENPLSITEFYIYFVMMFLFTIVGLVGVASAANQDGTENGDFPSLLRRGDSVPSGRSAMLKAASFRPRSPQVAANTKMAGPRLMATLSPPSGSSYGLGKAVAVSDQGKVLAGARESDNHKGKGKVFLYDAKGGGKLQVLVVDNLEDGSEFGDAVAFLKDAAVIGAPGVNSGQGAVYKIWTRFFFLKEQTIIAKIIAEDGAPRDKFGSSLAASGGNIAVGAPGDNSGSVYLYPSRIKVTAEDGSSGDYFGCAVALSNAALVVGARNNGFKYRGAAYVFEPDSTGGYVQTKKLTAFDGDAYDLFGYAVAITDTKIFVGAPYHDIETVVDVDKAGLYGAIYQYRLSKDYDFLWRYVGQVGDHLGYSLAATNTVLAVGSPKSGSGTVYIYDEKYYYNPNAITIKPNTADGVLGCFHFWRHTRGGNQNWKQGLCVRSLCDRISRQRGSLIGGV